MWDTGSIPIELGCAVLVLIPKGNAYTWGIGVLELVWKAVEAMIDTHINTVVQFHNVLHGFRAGGGAKQWV